MDDDFRTLDRGTVYIDQGGIVAVQDAAQPPPAGFEATSRRRCRGDDLSRAHRAPQPPRLQRAAACGTCRGSSPTAGNGAARRVPASRDRTDESPRADRGRHAVARPLCRVQVPRRRRDDEPGHRALQQCRRPALLPRHRPQRRADRRARPAGSGDADCGRGREEPRAFPGAPQEADVPAAAPERRRRPDGAEALPRAAAARAANGRSPRRSPASTAPGC